MNISRFILLFSSLLAQGAYGQNLIANGSFEDQNLCVELNATCCPAAWIYITNNPVGYESNYVALSATGRQHLFFLAANRMHHRRQYWQTKLLCPLQAGRRYKASVKVAGRRVDPDPRDIGFYFTDGFLFPAADTLLQPTGYLAFADARVTKMENGWFLLEKEFTATENKQFLVLGNFAAKGNREILTERKTNVASILVDDLGLEPLDGAGCADSTQAKDWLYAFRKRHTIPRDGVPEQATAPVIDTLVINSIQFGFDSYKLKDSAILRMFQPFFEKGDVEKVKVVGFTDDAGSADYNRELSQKRAVEVATLLKLMYGLPDAVLEAEGKGISTDYDNKKKNRRVEVYVFHKK